MSDDEPQINLTPLIDVVFVILIMFLIIAPLLENDHVSLAEGAHCEAVSSQSPITIHVLKNNTILINQKEVSIGDLPSLLKQAKFSYPGAQPQLFQDKEAQFGTYQMVKNAAAAAGFETLDVILNSG